MRLNTLFSNPGSKKKAKLRGRGIGSGLGKTSGKGHKGQEARSGVAIKGFEGGQMPIYRRIPKRGFNSMNRIKFNSINLGDLERFIKNGRLDDKNVTKEMLVDLGIVKKIDLPLKLLAKGKFTRSTTIEVDFASVKAVEVVSKNGGKVVFPSAQQDA